MKLFRTITLMLVFLTAVPIGVVGFILIESNVDALKTMTWELQQERADHASKEMAAYFDNIIEDLDLLVSTLSTSSMSLRQRQELLSYILQKRPEVNIIAFYDDSLRPLPNLLAFDSKRILPSELANHQAHIASIHLPSNSSESMSFSAPYTIAREGRSDLAIDPRTETAVAMMLQTRATDLAFLGMEISLTPLQSAIDKIHLSPDGEAMLVDLESHLIAHKSSVPKIIQESNQRQGLINQIVSSITSNNASSLPISGARPIQVEKNRNMLLAYAPLKRPAWLLISLEPLDIAYRATRKMIWQVITVVLISMALAMGLGVLFAFGITRPIAKCVSGALAIARGRFGYSITTKARNEIGELAHTFNYMSRQLLDYDQENKQLVLTLEKGYLETIRALANSIDAKDPYTRGHSVRVTNMALAVGRELGLGEEEIHMLRYAGILHDIGKIGIREAILSKKGTLDDTEREIMRTHPVLGEKIIEPIVFLPPVRSVIRHHHEWFDGSGYPDGLGGAQIPLGARIINATDTYDAVTSERPYQQAVDNQKAIDILLELRNRQIDPKVCDALIVVIKKRIAAGQLSPAEWEGEYTDPT